MTRPTTNGRSGVGVDYTGNPVIDPTDAVRALVEANKVSAALLREADIKFNDSISGHLKEIGNLRAQHQRELDHAESERLDAIRQVDREDVNKTATAAQTAIATLATAATATAETLRNQVAATAQTAEARRATDTQEINKRLSALELSSSEGKGKQAIADPQLAVMVEELRKLTSAGSVSSGKTAGVSWVGTLVVGAIVFIASAVSIAVALYAALKTH